MQERGEVRDHAAGQVDGAGMGRQEGAGEGEVRDGAGVRVRVRAGVAREDVRESGFYICCFQSYFLLNT